MLVSTERIGDKISLVLLNEIRQLMLQKYQNIKQGRRKKGVKWQTDENVRTSTYYN